MDLVELQWFIPSAIWLSKFSFKIKVCPPLRLFRNYEEIKQAGSTNRGGEGEKEENMYWYFSDIRIASHALG